MLQGEQAVVNELSDWKSRGIDPEDPARLSHGAILPCPVPPTGWPADTLGAVIDLHVHSTCSDGSETPERVVELAAAAGCTAMALTDHDGLDGVTRARARADDLGIGFVAGCEISCAFSPGTMHVLCYFVEPGDGPLQAELERLRLDRSSRNERLLARLAELGLPVSLEEVQATAGSSVIGRPHFAAVLVNNGAATSIQDAFDRLLGKGTPGYVSKTRIDADAAISAARGSSAAAVLAHPLSLGLEMSGLERVLEELATLGLVGVECYYSRYSVEQRAQLATIAKRLGLVATGGSDFHGAFKPDLSVGTGTGDLDVPETALAELVSRRPEAGQLN
jgi:predicted metal-dependent phosphoesterase TrpH